MEVRLHFSNFLLPHYRPLVQSPPIIEIHRKKSVNLLLQEENKM